MSRRDEELTEKDNIDNQLENEVAATTLAGQPRVGPYYTGSVSQRPSIRHGLFYAFIVLIIIGLTAGITSLIIYKNESATVIEGTTFVEQINELAVLATAEAHVKEVLEIEDNKLFGKNIPFSLFGAANRQMLIIVPATVVAGVDLKGITAHDVTVDEEAKTISIQLPRATLLQDPAIDVESIITYSDEGLFRGEAKWDEGVEFLQLAQEKVREQVLDIDLYNTAEQNAVKALQNFFSSLGYQVTVSFN